MVSPPINERPYMGPGAPGFGKEMHTTTEDAVQHWRQIGWLGQSGAFYAFSERPMNHEPGGWSPLWTMLENEPKVSDTDCVDKYGNSFPEHDFGQFDCRRCGAEAEPEN